MIYHLTFFSFLLLCIITAFRYRHSIIPLLPRKIQSILPISQSSGYAPLTTFESQRAAGLNSSTFDIESNNVLAGDSRLGLDEQGAQEVREIMQRHRVGFDEARLIRHNQILARNGIDPSGMPLDSKAVTRL